MNRFIQIARNIYAALRNRVNPPAVGMTSAGEQAYYCLCAREAQPGVIVDLGCWMGSTTMALAKGSRENPKGPLPIHAYDLFEWSSWMDSFAGNLHGRYLPGESFLPEARGRIREYAGFVTMIKADLTQTRWDGASISILLVDAMKNAELTSRIAEAFLPHLSPGGHLIHQDFKHFYTPWIHILQYRLRDCFCVAKDIADGSTVSFQLLSPILPERARASGDFSSIAEDEVEAAFRYGLDLVSEKWKPAVASAHVMYYIHTRKLELAQRWHDDYLRRNLCGGYDWSAMQQSLAGLRQSAR